MTMQKKINRLKTTPLIVGNEDPACRADEAKDSAP